MPPVIVADHNALGIIALGDKCPPLSYFAALQDPILNEEESTATENSSELEL